MAAELALSAEPVESTADRREGDGGQQKNIFLFPRQVKRMVVIDDDTKDRGEQGQREDRYRPEDQPFVVLPSAPARSRPRMNRRDRRCGPNAACRHPFRPARGNSSSAAAPPGSGWRSI